MFAQVCSSATGRQSVMMHPHACVYQNSTRVYAQFGDTRHAVIGALGIIFAQDNADAAYLVSSSTIDGARA
jgi:hypothetical protein